MAAVAFCSCRRDDRPFPYFQNLKQRRVENALKFISLFRDALEDGDLEHWQHLFRSTSECAGALPGHSLADDGQMHSIADYFSEGSGARDNYAISRMAQSLDVLCHQVNEGVADPRTVFYELGQYLSCMHRWLSAILSSPVGKETLLEASFPSIDTFFKKYGKSLREWPCRICQYIE